MRGSAGLHFALPVAQLGEDALELIGPRQTPAHTVPAGVPSEPRPLIALDPDGAPLRPGELPARSILAFGAERQGLSKALLDRADARVCLPMREGVSSLNLATSVAAVLYSWRLADVERRTWVD